MIDLPDTIGNNRKANEPGKETQMARRRYQMPTPKLRGQRWEIVVREDVVNDAGRLQRVQKRVTLGYSDAIRGERAARRVAEPILARLNAAVARPQKVIRFGEFCERWKQTVLLEMKPSTQSSMRSVIERHLKPALGGCYLHDISSEMVQRFVAGLRQSGLGEKSVWNIVMALRSVWRTALDWGYVREKVFNGVRVRLARPSEVRCLSLQDIKLILQAAPEPQRTFYWLAAETGMRAGELCGLRWQDVDPLERTVSVRQSAWRGKITTPKTVTALRTMAVSEALADRLNAMRNGSELVFHSKNGTPWDANLLVKRKLQPLLKRLGIARCGLHAFRHFAATQMNRMAAPSGLMRSRLGHASLIVTDRYTHAVGEDDRQVANQMAGSMNVTFRDQRTM